MRVTEVQLGSTITNGSSCMRITGRVEKSASWGTAGWRGTCISLERFGGNTGMTDFIPDHLLSPWRHVPFEWKPMFKASRVEERYVWSADWSWLRREVRPCE